MTIKLLFFAGSARSGSFNKMLARAAYEHACSIDGVEAKHIDLRDYPMPIYDGDFEDEHGLPEHAIRFKALLIEHDGFFVASPEYNSSISPLLKNAIDWASRKQTEEEPALVAYKGKVAAITGASPGGFGGLRGLVPLRMLLGNISVTVIPEQLAVPHAMSAFDEKGQMKDEKQYAQLCSIVDRLAAVTKALKRS